MLSVAAPPSRPVYALFDKRDKRIFAVKHANYKTAQVLFLQKTDAFRLGLALEENLIATGDWPCPDLENDPDSILKLPTTVAKRHALAILEMYAFESYNTACVRAESNYMDVLVIRSIKKAKGVYQYDSYIVKTDENVAAMRLLAQQAFRKADAFN